MHGSSSDLQFDSFMQIGFSGFWPIIYAFFSDLRVLVCFEPAKIPIPLRLLEDKTFSKLMLSESG